MVAIYYFEQRNKETRKKNFSLFSKVVTYDPTTLELYDIQMEVKSGCTQIQKESVAQEEKQTNRKLSKINTHCPIIHSQNSICFVFQPTVDSKQACKN